MNARIRPKGAALWWSIVALMTPMPSGAWPDSPDIVRQERADRYADMPPVPSSGLDLLRNIKYAFDRRILLDRANFDERLMHRLFGASTYFVVKDKPYTSGAMERGSLECGPAGLCADQVRFALRRTTDAACVATLYAPKIEADVTKESIDLLFERQGKVSLRLPSPHDLSPKTEYLYDLGDGNEVMAQFGYVNHVMSFYGISFRQSGDAANGSC